MNSLGSHLGCKSDTSLTSLMREKWNDMIPHRIKTKKNVSGVICKARVIKIQKNDNNLCTRARFKLRPPLL